MEKLKEESFKDSLPPVRNAVAAIRYFQENLASGKHWYVALLETIGLWTDECEDIQGQHYQYLIEGEAFDWLLLAERLCETVDSRVPEKEKFDLLFRNRPPLRLTSSELKKTIGPGKYHQYLNYFYGITVEEALVQAVREEVRKERMANGLSYRREKEEDDTFMRIYGEPEAVLLKQFRKEKHYPLAGSSNISEMKSFTYWCFKFRVRESEKARVASDTHKALEWLQRNGYNINNPG